jgi:hypothetical protein
MVHLPTLFFSRFPKSFCPYKKLFFIKKNITNTIFDFHIAKETMCNQKFPGLFSTSPPQIPPIVGKVIALPFHYPLVHMVCATNHHDASIMFILL